VSAFYGGASDLDAAMERALRGTSSLVERASLDGLPEALAPWRVAFMPFALGGAVTMLVESLAEQSDVQRAFAASERRFRVLVDAAVDGIAMHRRGVVLYVNPAAVRMLGYGAAEEMIGRPVQELVHPDDRSALQERLRLAEAGREVPLRGEKFLKRDGSTVDVEAQVSRAPVDNGYASFVFFRDVTERKRMAQELERASRLESLGRMAGGVAHDFNNLISTMMRSLELARADLAAPDRAAQALDAADAAARRARDVTRQLLTFSRGSDAVATAVDANEIVEEALSLVSRGADPRVRFVQNLTRLEERIWIGSCQLHQVVLNLLLNARDAVRGGGTINVTTSQDDGRISITVEDDGVGMAADVRAKIFEPFFTTKPESEGTGLGLATAYGIVRQAGGHIEVSSEVGGGSRFVVTLPARAPEVEVRRVERQAGGRQRARRVLICDDEHRLASLTAQLLREHGFEVDTASDAEQALSVLMGEQAAFSVLLLDVNLPGEGSSVLLDRLQASGRGLPVVLTSGYAEDDVPEQIREHRQVVGYLQKPYTVDALATALDGVVERARVGESD
jgi:PAS domain S-box-containing protein